MSARLNINSHLKDFPFALSWTSATTRSTFDGILFSFVGLPAGQTVNYHGPVAAWIGYEESDTRLFAKRHFLLDIVYGDSKANSQLVIQAEVRLSEPIRVNPGSTLTLHFATPLTAQVPPESTTISSTAWDVRYGLRGRYF